MGKYTINLKEDIGKQVKGHVTKENNFQFDGKLYTCTYNEHSITKHDINNFIKNITNKLKKLNETDTVEINISITSANLQRLKPS